MVRKSQNAVTEKMTEPQSNQACKHNTIIGERKEIMKQFIQAISGKEALYVVIAIAAWKDETARGMRND